MSRVLMLLALILAPWPCLADAQTVDDRFLIRPGEGVGALDLGMDRDEVIRKLGRPTEEDGSMYAYVSEKTGNVLFLAFSDQDELEIILFSSPDFHTADGHSTENFLTMPFIERYNINVSPVDRDFYLLMDKQRKIAFVRLPERMAQTQKIFGIVYRSDLVTANSLFSDIQQESCDTDEFLERVQRSDAGESFMIFDDEPDEFAPEISDVEIDNEGLSEKPILVSASDLNAVFKENVAKARALYLNKTIQVVGKVGAIDTYEVSVFGIEATAGYAVMLETGLFSMPVACLFNMSNEEQVASLSVGQEVVIQGTCTGIEKEIGGMVSYVCVENCGI